MTKIAVQPTEVMIFPGSWLPPRLSHLCSTPSARPTWPTQQARWRQPAQPQPHQAAAWKNGMTHMERVHWCPEVSKDLHSPWTWFSQNCLSADLGCDHLVCRGFSSKKGGQTNMAPDRQIGCLFQLLVPLFSELWAPIRATRHPLVVLGRCGLGTESWFRGTFRFQLWKTLAKRQIRSTLA